MKASTSAIPQANPRTAATRKGLLARLRHALGLEPPSREEVRRRMRSKPGLYDSLSPETLEYLRNYDGPEHLGPLEPQG
jgi:hypothetical protein